MPVRVNVTAAVNSKSIRRETYNGKEHWVVPSYTLPANVIMNGGLYPASEIDAHYETLDGTLAPFGHPMVNGEYVSAFSPEGINAGHVGAWNRNVKKSGNRIYVEKYIDVEVAKLTENGQRLLERLEQLENNEDVPPIHTSVGVYLEELEANEAQKSMGAEWVAKIHSIDHDAILLDEVGAATPEQGVGMMVNADKATPIKANIGALEGNTYRFIEDRLERAARELFGNEETSIWVADFNQTQAIVYINSKSFIYDYAIQDGKAVISGDGKEVESKRVWDFVPNAIKSFFNRSARLNTKKEEGDMPLTTEEKAELTTEISEAVIGKVGDVVANAIKPLAETVDAVKANHDALTEKLNANENAEAEALREEVKAEYGMSDEQVSVLDVNALKVMRGRAGSTAPLGVNSANNNSDFGQVSLSDRFGH